MCHAILPIESFPKRPTKRKPDNRRNECQSCLNQKSNAIYHQNPERHKEYVARWRRKITGTETNVDRQRRWNRENYWKSLRERRQSPEHKARARGHEFSRRMRRYGITKERYEEVLAAQRNACAICSVEFAEIESPAIDHWHRENKFRGLLCRGCNTALHKLERDLKWAEKAISYLERGACNG